MQIPQSIYGLNAFVALEHCGVQQWVAQLERDMRSDLNIRLRNHVARQSFNLVRDAYTTFGPTLSTGPGTGRLPAHPGRISGHVPNPGMDVRLDSVHAMLRGALFSPIVAVMCAPWLPWAGLNPSTAVLGLCVGGGATALALHRARLQGLEAPWLEGAAGLFTALGRASLTTYAAVLGAGWGRVTFFAARMSQTSNANRR